MITMDNSNRRLRYIAGGCFSACAVAVAIDIAQAGYASFYILCHLFGIPYAIIAVSMFASLPILTVVGIVAYAIPSFVFTVLFILWVFIYGETGFTPYIMFYFLSSVFSVILLLAGLMRNKAKMLGLVAGSVAFFQFVYVIVMSAMSGLDKLLWIGVWVNYPLMSIGAFMFGFASDNNPNKAKILQPSTSTNDGLNDSFQSQFERLTILKNLLDSGIISNEEFEAKKKLILHQ